MGGAAGINMILGMVRVKFAAVLIGTTGVGLLASFGSIQGFIGTIAGMGIQSSAVRDVAAAVGRGDQDAIGRAVHTLRRVCWFTGIAGMLAMMLLSPLLSQITFGHQEYAIDIAALGLIILFANVSGGQMALIQGMRRIGDMARANVYGAALGTISAFGLYTWLGLRGIVPSLMVVSGISLVISWFFAKRIPVPQTDLSWKQTFTEAGGMIKLGLVLMWNGLLGSAVTYITITLITQYESIQAVGIYSAAFALSGVFVNFVLQAMGADYYPRLTSVADDKSAVNRMVNEQTEIGLLLAVPGLLATLALAPWIIQLFYTAEFLPAVELLQWFLLGCLGRVLSWPLGFVMLALGKGNWFFVTETSFNVLHVGMVALGIYVFGLVGVALAFFVLYIGYTVAVFFVVRHLTGFSWSSEAKRLNGLAILALCSTLAVVLNLSTWPATLVGGSVTLVATLYSLRGLIRRLGENHQIARLAFKVPGLRNALHV